MFALLKSKTSSQKIIERFAPDLERYNKKKLMADISAGIVVGIVALPLSLALAIAAGVPPIVGLYTAAVAGTLSSVFAGSRFSVSGPAAAMVPVLAAIIAEFGIDKIAYIGLLAALFLVVFGLTGVGKVITRIPESVVLGFTAGVSIVIIAGQLNAFFGLSGIHKHLHFHENLIETISSLATFHFPTIGIGILSIIIILYSQKLRFLRSVPATLVAVTVTTVLVAVVPAFKDVTTLSSAYGAITAGLPQLIPAIPSFETGFVVPALKIALLISIETLLCAMVADRLTRTRHNPSQELIAQGIGNVGSVMFGGIPSTAVIARTGTIIKSGAVSRLAGVIHGITILAFLAILAPLANTIPLAALSAILIVTAVRISEYEAVIATIKKHAADFDATLLATLLLTVFTDLTIGVSVGVIMYIVRRKVFGRKRETNKALEEALLDNVEAGITPPKPTLRTRIRRMLRRSK